MCIVLVYIFYFFYIFNIQKTKRNNLISNNKSKPNSIRDTPLSAVFSTTLKKSFNKSHQTQCIDIHVGKQKLSNKKII